MIFVVDVCMAFKARSTCFTKRTGRKKSIETMSWKTLPEDGLLPRPTGFGGSRISKLLKQLAIIPGTARRKNRLFHLLERAIVDGLHLKNRSVATLGCGPLSPAIRIVHGSPLRSEEK